MKGNEMLEQLPKYECTAKPEWLDYNGHMNVAYYVLAFDFATDAIYEVWEIGEAYQQEGYSVFTLGMNVDYLREVFAGEQLTITTQLLDLDHKRIHYFHQMFKGETNELVATNECLCMNVDWESRRSAPFPDEKLARLQEVFAEHQKYGTPHGAFRQLEIRRKE